MLPKTADVVICGAGIAGISAAYHLAVRQGVQNIVIVDERPPLTLTSDKSTECYRNWWPGPGDAMVRFMNRSIDLLEELAAETDNSFGLNRRGYIFLTADEARATTFSANAAAISALGAGPVRLHDGTTSTATYQKSEPHGFDPALTGVDLITDRNLIQQHYPFLNSEIRALLHPRRCGWFSAQQLGMYLLERAKEAGVKLVSGTVIGVEVDSEQVRGVSVRNTAGEAVIQTNTFVVAAGPYVKNVAAMLGVDLPVFNELHAKIAFKDHLGIVPRDAPMMILSDPLRLPWTEAERAELEEDEETHWLLEELPGGAHFRPEGREDSPILLMLWTYDVEPVEPVWPPTFEPLYAEIVLRGLTKMIPGLEAYVGKMSRPQIDGGYYCKTQENRPLICPLPVEGAYMLGAISGYGQMASQAAGDLLAAHITGNELPDYAPAFNLDRYNDPEYRKMLELWDPTSGQL